MGLPMTNSNFYPTSLVDIVRQTGLETYSPAHRLDMCTSGLVVGGLSRYARGNLNGQFYRREVAKYYVAALDGTIDEHGVVDAPSLHSREHDSSIVRRKASENRILGVGK